MEIRDAPAQNGGNNNVRGVAQNCDGRTKNSSSHASTAGVRMNFPRTGGLSRTRAPPRIPEMQGAAKHSDLSSEKVGRR